MITFPAVRARVEIRPNAAGVARLSLPSLSRPRKLRAENDDEDGEPFSSAG